MRGRVLIVLAILAILGLYFSGRLDRPLYGIGLNFHECGRNGLGATFCGSELDEYRQKVARPIQGASESVERLKRESEERQARERAGREAEEGSP